MNRMIVDLEACVQEGKSITADQIDLYNSDKLKCGSNTK